MRKLHTDFNIPYGVSAFKTILASCFLCGAAALTEMPKTATLIPAPREIRATGGEYWDKKPPKLEKVAGLPPEGYELSITTNGITIRHSDDAGAFYAQITLFHSGRWDSKAKCKVYPCLEIRDWPQFRWRGVHLDDSRRFFGKEAGLQLLKQMSWFKFNVLHWHLTDDQLWSLEIPGFPELQKYGAEWYISGPAKWRGEKVGPLYYTANDVKGNVAARIRARGGALDVSRSRQARLQGIRCTRGELSPPPHRRACQLRSAEVN